MEPLEHDPRTKQQIKEALYQYLYAPVTQQFAKRIEQIIVDNTKLGGFTHKHFIYKGVVYNADVTNPPLRKNRLVNALKGEMDQYLKEKDELNTTELPYVLGFINQVLNSSNNFSDYLQVLPESIHEPLLRLQATCPCRASYLNPETIAALQAKNHNSIKLIKQRLVLNLLI